jgi:hypothetical protein
MSITLAIRQFISTLGRHPQALKAGGAVAGGAVAGWSAKGIYDKFNIKLGAAGQSINILPFILVAVALLYLKKTGKI